MASILEKALFKSSKCILRKKHFGPFPPITSTHWFCARQQSIRAFNLIPSFDCIHAIHFVSFMPLFPLRELVVLVAFASIVFLRLAVIKFDLIKYNIYTGATATTNKRRHTKNPESVQLMATMFARTHIKYQMERFPAVWEPTFCHTFDAVVGTEVLRWKAAVEAEQR